MSAFNFYRDLFEGCCKKYSYDGQQGFGQNLKVILAKDIPRPKPNKSKQPTVTFRQNKATGGFETVRQNKKRKNMEVEAPEMKPIGSLHSKFQPPGKEKSVAPQLKKNKMTLDTDSNQPKVTLITLNFNKEKSQRPLPVVNQLPQKRANAFSQPKGAGESVFKPKRSPLRKIDFEEEKALERHMYQVDLEEIHVGPNRHKREIGLQTSEVKPSNKDCQTSPLREKNLTNLPVNLKKDLTVAAKSENSQQICIETTFSQQQQVDNSINQESIEINRAEQQHDVDVSKVLRFDFMESVNEQKQPEPVIVQQTQEMSERPLAPVQTENPEPKASAKKPLFSFETQLQNAFSLNEPAQQAPVELANSTTNPLGSMKKTVVAPPKPTFDFLNVYKQNQPATESMVNDDNPFLSHKSEAPVVQQQQQDVQNVNVLPAANPFLKPEGNFGILGLVGSNGNNSSENKIMNNFDGGLKPVSNIGLFNSNPQSLFGPVPTTPAPAANVNNGLFSNVNTIPRNPINNNNNGPTNNLFSNLNTVPQNNNNFNQQPPSFTNQLFGNDRMDISDNSSFMQQQHQQNFNNGLFNSNMHSNTMNNNTPSFLTNNNSTNNGLFSNLAPSQPPMNQNNVSNGLFSNNMMPGARNNMTQSMMNDPFSNNSMNNQPQNPLFMNSGNNGMMNNQLNFNNNAPSPSFLPQQQQQPQMNLFSNNNAPSKLVFGNNNNNINNSQSPFGNNTNNNMNNNMNNDMNPFVNNNHTNMNQPFQMNNQGSNMNQGMNFMNPQRSTQDAQNFLGTGGNTNGGGETNQGGQGTRVYRRIMQPTNKNKERAF